MIPSQLVQLTSLAFAAASTSAYAATATPAYAAAAASAPGGFFLLFTLSCRSITFYCSFPADRASLANTHILGRATSRERGKPEQRSNHVAVQSDVIVSPPFFSPGAAFH